jgi:hypothetical protein
MVYATFPRISPDDQQQTLKHVRYGAHFEAETNIVRCRLRVLAVSKRLLEKVISGSSNDAGSFRGLPMP